MKSRPLEIWLDFINSTVTFFLLVVDYSVETGLRVVGSSGSYSIGFLLKCMILYWLLRQRYMIFLSRCIQRLKQDHKINHDRFHIIQTFRAVRWLLTVLLHTSEELIQYICMCLYIKCLNVHKKSDKIIVFGLIEHEMKVITTKHNIECLRISCKGWRML
jgi:hypothetical protein